MAPSLPRVVITDCDHGTTAPEEEVLGGQVALEKYQRKDETGLLEICRDADGIITQYGAFTRRVIACLARCRVIARYGVGVDTVDLAAATDHGIVVANVPDYATEEVSNHAVALLLALHRKIVRLDAAVKTCLRAPHRQAGTWDFRVGGPVPRLAGLTLGLIGLGRIGAMVAGKLRPFGLSILAADPGRRDFPDWIRPATLDELLPRSDILSIHCPLTAETQHLIDEAALRRMKPTALLINTARGGIVDTAALGRALREGWIAGAGLDVLEEEPLPGGHPLASLANVILTPHAAWYSAGSIVELKRKVAAAVLEALRGRTPASVANPEVLDRRR